MIWNIVVTAAVQSLYYNYATFLSQVQPVHGSIITGSWNEAMYDLVYALSYSKTLRSEIRETVFVINLISECSYSSYH